MISIRRISIGGGFRYLMNSVAGGDGAAEPSSCLPPTTPSPAPLRGCFWARSRRSRRREGARSRLEGERGAPAEHARRVLGSGERRAGRIASEAQAGGAPVAGFDLCFSPPKSSRSCGLSLTTRREMSSRIVTERRSNTSSPTRKKRSSTRVLARTGSSKKTSPGSSQPPSPTSRAGRTTPSCTAMSWSGTREVRVRREVEDP